MAKLTKTSEKKSKKEEIVDTPDTKPEEKKDVWEEDDKPGKKICSSNHTYINSDISPLVSFANADKIFRENHKAIAPV